MKLRVAGSPARVAAALIAAFAAAAATAPPAAAAPFPVSITASGANGVGRATEPGLSCDAGGDGASWHYGYETSLPAGTFTSLRTGLRLNLDVHGDGLGLGQDAPTGFLQGSESTAALVNERGTVVLRLSDGGSCAHPTANLTRTNVQTSGTWEVAPSSGSYATAAGTGTFTVDAGVAPGADNPWTLNLAGDVTVAQPALDVRQLDTWWGALGIDYLTRRPTVLVRVTNTGAGDAFAVRLTGAAPTTSGVRLLAGAPADLGDLLAGESVDVVLRYQLGLAEPCAGVVLNCEFNVSFGMAMVDALDAAVTDVDPVHLATPLIVPPL